MFQKLFRLAPAIPHQSVSQIAHEISACIGCNECLIACPALETPLTVESLNHATLYGAISAPVERFAQRCYQCGGCVDVCPVGLHRDAMMLWLKLRLLKRGKKER